MKVKLKPRNHVALALSKRGGSGSHQKSHKQLRGKLNREGWGLGRLMGLKL